MNTLRTIVSTWQVIALFGTFASVGMSEPFEYKIRHLNEVNPVCITQNQATGRAQLLHAATSRV